MIKQMKTFIQLAEYKDFEKAANKRLVSQEEAIRQVEYLESVLGVPLIEEKNKNIELTDAGKSYYRDVKEIVYESDESILRARETKLHDPYIIRVGASLLNPCKDLLYKWNELQEQYPQYKLKVVTFEDGDDALSETYDALGRCDVLVGVCDSETWKEFFGLLQMGEYKFSYLMAKNHPLAKKKILSLTELCSQRLVIQKKGISGAMDTARYYIKTHHPQIQIQDTENQFDMEVFNKCAEGDEIVLALDAWNRVHPSLVMVPSDMGFAIPYGLLYPINPDPLVAKFVKSLEGLEGRIR